MRRAVVDGTADGDRYRPPPRRGEQRRDALLAALGELLAAKPLARIGIGEITERAGVTRSGFYFYFPTKAAAVAGLLEDIHRALHEASGRWHGADPGSGADLLRAGFDAVVTYTRDQAHLLVAVVEAGGAPPRGGAVGVDGVGADRVGAEMWERGMHELADRVADKITRDRAAGVAPPGADAAALGFALVAMNVRTLESEARAVLRGDATTDTTTDALVQIWRRSVYGGD